MNGKKLSIFIVSILFFLSGAAGLMYQTVWARLLEMYFGVTLTSVTLIVAAYMAGLGLGSLLGGRIAASAKNAVLLYGLVEAGIGAFGIVSPALINWVGQSAAGSPYALAFALSFALLLVPTLLMGMTLPLLTQAFVSRVETSGEVVGLLYGVNTLGAAFGALLSGYVLMGWYGFGATLFAAAGLNFLVGLGAASLRARPEFSRRADSIPAAEPLSAPRPAWNYPSILFSAFLVGFVGMGFEMLWFRALGVFNKHTAYGFPSVLFVFLVALAVGGWFWGKKADQSPDPVNLFWKLEAWVGIVSAASFLSLWALMNVPQAESWLRQNFNQYQQPAPMYVFPQNSNEILFSKRALVSGLLEYFLPILALTLPAGLLMGGGLPALDRIAIDRADLSGRRVGDVHLANILGSVLGTLAVSFVLLPAFGSEWTLKILCLLTLAYLPLYLLARRSRPTANIVAIPLILILLIALLPGRGELYARMYQIAAGRRSVVVRESGDGLLALSFRGEKTDPADLWIGGVKNSFFPSDGTYENALMTCAAANRPARILVIGLGGGHSANFAASLPGVKEVVVVELMEELDGLLREYAPVARSALERPSVSYIVDDGRRYLYANPEEKFDLIFIDPLWSFTAGHNNLYSREAALLYKSHLAEGGVFCAWINERHFIPKTAATVFPHSELYADFIVNSLEPIAYDRAYMRLTYENYLSQYAAYLAPEAEKAMNPDVTLSGLRANRETLLQSEARTPPLTDLTPWLEYYYLCPPQFMKTLRAQQLRYCASRH